MPPEYFEMIGKRTDILYTVFNNASDKTRDGVTGTIFQNFVRHGGQIRCPYPKTRQADQTTRIGIANTNNTAHIRYQRNRLMESDSKSTFRWHNRTASFTEFRHQTAIPNRLSLTLQSARHLDRQTMGLNDFIYMKDVVENPRPRPLRRLYGGLIQNTL